MGAALYLAMAIILGVTSLASSLNDAKKARNLLPRKNEIQLASDMY